MLKLRVTPLEERCVPALYIVDSAAEAGCGTLRQAIIESNASVGVDDEIRIDVSTVDVLSALPTLMDDVSIFGNLEAMVRRDATASGYFRLFDIAAGIDVELKDLIISGAENNADGGAIRNLGNLTIRHCQILDNHVVTENGLPRYGGGIVSNGTLSIFDSYIAFNRVEGANTIFSSDGSRIEGGGGGLAVLGGSVSLSNVSIDQNTAVGDDEGGTPSNGAGGGLYVSAGNVTANFTAFTRNSVEGAGGGIYVFGGNVFLRHTTTAFNVAIDGVTRGVAGGIMNTWGTVTLNLSIVGQNENETAPDVNGLISNANNDSMIHVFDQGLSPPNQHFYWGVNPHVYMPELYPNGGSTWAPPLPILVRDSTARTFGTVGVDIGARPLSLHGTEAVYSRSTLATLGTGGTAVVFAINSQDQLQRYDASNGWRLVAHGVRSIAATTDSAGREVVFAIFNADRLLKRWTAAGGWTTIGANVTSVSAAKDASGQPLAWVTGVDGALSVWRTSGGWMAKPLTGTNAVRSISAADNGQCVVLMEDRSIRVYTATSSTLIANAGFARSLDAVSVNGKLTVFAITPRSDLFSYSPGETWAPRANLVAEVSASSFGGQAVASLIMSIGSVHSYSVAGGFQEISGPWLIREFSQAAEGAVAAILRNFAINLFSPGSWSTIAHANFATE